MKLTIILTGLMFFSVIARSDMALGKMAASYPHKISDIITEFSKEGQNKQILEMALLAQDVFDVTQIYNYSREHGQVQIHNVVNSIRGFMTTQPKWNTKLPAEKLKKLEANKTLLSNTFGETSYEWAWVLNQLGDKVGAKKILSPLFENEYKNVMVQKHATFGLDGGGPLSRLEPAYNALETLTEGKEKTELKDKMGKAKIYISTLPQSHIMT